MLASSTGPQRSSRVTAPGEIGSTICVAVMAGSREELTRKSLALLPEFPFQELRLDHLADPAAALDHITQHIVAHPDATLLATCRRIASGGNFTGTPEAELAILLAAARSGCRFVDLALESAELLPRVAVQQLRSAGAHVVLSWHDFDGTGDLGAVLDRMRPFAPDLYKIVPTARNLLDNLRLLDLLEASRSQDLQTVGICMGEAGVLSRVLGVRAGSAFTFAAASNGETTAPGQTDAATLRDRYRVGSITAGTKVFGVAGDPIASSLSPAMLNAAFAAANVDAVYLPLRTQDPAELFQLARQLPLAGFSVTMPLKQSVLPSLGYIDPLAAKIGAVNTVRREANGSFSGFNTDVAGIVGPLESRMDLRGARVLVLGAGGAARAAVFACTDRGAEVFICNRTYETAAALASQAGATALRPQELPKTPDFDVILNATPAGMRGNSTALPLVLEDLRAELVFDMVYNPQDTPLLLAARERGIATIPGVEMFVRQGAAQFKLWTEQPAPVEVMREIVLQTLAQRGS